MFKKLIITLLLVTTSLTFALENSITSKMEQVQAIETLRVNKYAKNQYRQITEALQQKENALRLVTYNMLFDLYDHNLAEENRWPQRRPRIVEMLNEMHPELISTQELYPHQLEALLSQVGDVYAVYAEETQEESQAILYRKDRFELIAAKELVLSGKKSLSMVHLKDLLTDQEFALFNIHLSFGDINKREKEAEAMQKQIDAFASETNLPVLLTGDMNLFPHRLDLEKLPFFDGDYIDSLITSGTLKDAKRVSLLGHLGPLSTFTNAQDSTDPFSGTGTPGVFLDRIYVSDKVSVLIHATQPATVDGHYPSDHMPLVIDFLLNP